MIGVLNSRTRSLEIELLLHVEPFPNGRYLYSLVSWGLVDGKGQVRNGSSEIFNDLLLPIWEAGAVIDKVVVSLQARLDFGEQRLDARRGWVAIHIHRDGGVIRADTGLKNIHGSVQLSWVLEDAIDLFIVMDLFHGLFKVRHLLSLESSG